MKFMYIIFEIYLINIIYYYFNNGFVFEDFFGSRVFIIFYYEYSFGVVVINI